MIINLQELIKTMFVGDMGIKTVKSAGKTIYERPGGFIYIKLENKQG